MGCYYLGGYYLGDCYVFGFTDSLGCYEEVLVLVVVVGGDTFRVVFLNLLKPLI